MFDVVSDALLFIGAIGASVYCHILSGRLKRLNALEGGMGTAIAVLSAQVDEMKSALAVARQAADGSANGLSNLVTRAETAAARLDLLLASMHDLPSDDDMSPRRLRFARRRREVEAAE
ncbi:MAG: hypothetical protein Q27BPR15_00860 [Rhodobacter sp. CACIA14H1]|nr:MAG: hypothetical protein Q27BPR15_00860 [Rhodobacter sp. CACIA14H1]